MAGDTHHFTLITIHIIHTIPILIPGTSQLVLTLVGDGTAGIIDMLTTRSMTITHIPVTIHIMEVIMAGAIDPITAIRL